MKTLQTIAEYYKKNRILILSALLVIVLVHWCSQRGEKIRETEGANTEQSSPVSVENPTPPQSTPFVNWLPYLIMVGAVVLVYFGKKRGWIEKLIPGFVLLRISVFRSKENKRKMLRIFIVNTTKTGQTFAEPQIEFVRFKGKKAFTIHVSGPAAFPITLTTNTSHILTIDLDRFYEKVPDLSNYNWVRVKMKLNGTKEKKSLIKWTR